MVTGAGWPVTTPRELVAGGAWSRKSVRVNFKDDSLTARDEGSATLGAQNEKGRMSAVEEDSVW